MATDALVQTPSRPPPSPAEILRAECQLAPVCLLREACHNVTPKAASSFALHMAPWAPRLTDCSGTSLHGDLDPELPEGGHRSTFCLPQEPSTKSYKQ